MKLKEIYSDKNQKTVVSFEIFPPKNDSDGEKLEKLLNHLKLLKKYNPVFISLTYGAGGTNQNASFDVIKKIRNGLDLSIMPHFTCVGSSKENVINYLNEIQNSGIENILALRGDIPQGMVQKFFEFKYANELVKFIKSETNLSIGVAGYPEGHLEAECLSEDLKNLKKKVNSGADAVYTQMFFKNSKFFEFMELTEKLGISVPVIPGILPIMSYQQLEKMLSMAKVTLPDNLTNKLEKYKHNPEDIRKIGIDFASEQCQQLLDAKVKGLHFYTINTSCSVSSVLDNISLK